MIEDRMPSIKFYNIGPPPSDIFCLNYYGIIAQIK
jgi:hypothetical protein